MSIQIYATVTVYKCTKTKQLSTISTCFWLHVHAIHLYMIATCTRIHCADQSALYFPTRKKPNGTREPGPQDRGLVCLCKETFSCREVGRTWKVYHCEEHVNSYFNQLWGTKTMDGPWEYNFLFGRGHTFVYCNSLSLFHVPLFKVIMLQIIKRVLDLTKK